VDAQEFPCNDAGTTKRATATQLKTFLWPALLVLSGDIATGANTTPVDLTGMTFDYVAGATYAIDMYMLVNPTAATTGCGFQMNLSVQTDSIMGMTFMHQLGNTGTVTGGSSTADDASLGVSTGMPTNGTNCPVMGMAFLKTTSDAGTVQFRFRSETTAVTTCKAGSVIRVMRVA